MRHPIRTLMTLGVTVIAVALAGCERPPPQAKQTGYRGLGMEQVVNPRTEKAKLAAIKLPDVQPAAEPGDVSWNDVAACHATRCRTSSPPTGDPPSVAATTPVAPTR